jgi:outer membrane murein-binding lipoprotein Lpp
MNRFYAITIALLIAPAINLYAMEEMAKNLQTVSEKMDQLKLQQNAINQNCEST